MADSDMTGEGRGKDGLTDEERALKEARIG